MYGSNILPIFGNYQTGHNIGKIGGNVSNDLQMFFQRYLLDKAISVYKWSFPKSWAEEYALYNIYCHGYVAVVNTDKFGIIPQGCGLMGFDVMYRPTNAIISNPLLKGILQPRIGKECELIRIRKDYGGIMDLVEYYGNLMALTAQTAGVNLTNSQLSYVFTAENKAAAVSFKEMHKKITQGEACVVQDSQLTRADGSPAWQLFQQNVGQNYIAGQLYDDLRKIEQRFDTIIGIPNANTEKRERLITDEVNSNNIETRSLAEMWLEELQSCVERVNEMFGTQINVEWRNEPGKVVASGEA